MEFTQIPPKLVIMLGNYYEGYHGKSFVGIVAPQETWDFMLDLLQSNDTDKIKKMMNGCGPHGVIDAVPDTFWGLRMTAICNIHDVTHKRAKTPSDCTLSNALFLMNLMTFVNNNSRSFLLRIFRRYRATTYYSMVEEAKRSYCAGYQNV